MKQILLNPDPTTGSSEQNQGGTESQVDSTAVNLYGDPGDGTPGDGDNTPADDAAAGGEAGGEGGEAQKPNGQYTVTAEVLAEALRQGGFGAPAQQQQQQQQTPPQMTEAEFDQLFHTFEPSEELLAGIYSEDPAARKAAFKQTGKLIVKNSLALAAHFQQQEAQKIRAEYAPALQDMTARQRAKLESDFYGKHKDLVGSEPLVNMVANQLQASGWTGTTEQAFEKVATQVRATLNQVLAKGQQQQQVAPGQQQQQNRQTAPKMSTVSTGGRGGAATGANKAAPKTTAFALFGPRK